MSCLCEGERFMNIVFEKLATDGLHYMDCKKELPISTDLYFSFIRYSNKSSFYFVISKCFRIKIEKKRFMNLIKEN